MKNTTKVQRNDLDNNERMKKLIEEDKKIIAKFSEGKYTTDNGYLNQIQANSDYRPPSKQTYAPIQPVRTSSRNEPMSRPS
jgi:hypothetical protein